MGTYKRPTRYPFSSWGRRWSRTFLIGFLAVILIMTLLDWLFADFEYIRIVDRLIIIGYGLSWLLLYWLRPDFFKDDEVSFSYRLLPQVIEEMKDLRRVGPVLLLGLGALVYVLGWLHNGWSYFLPSAVGPLLTSLFFAWRPLLFFPHFTRHGEIVRDRMPFDETVNQFINLLNSREAKRVLLLTGISASTSLCLAMAVILFLRSEALDWTFNVRAIVPLTFLFALWSMTLNYHFLLRWTLRRGSWRPER